jgi:LmbE family N-acetylglucosaminyl deacetylase
LDVKLFCVILTLPLFFKAACLAGALVSVCAFASGAEGPHAPEPLSIGAVRALIVSPHPDDATLATGGLIRRVLGAGGAVKVIQMTGGDGFPQGVVAWSPRSHPTADAYRQYGVLREHEAVRALGRLGVHRAQVRLLGFPDEGLCLLASSAPLAPVFISPYTQRESPPITEQVLPGTMYRGEDVRRELTRLLREFRPTLLVVPHSGDDHPDHCATHLLVHQALTAALADGLRPPHVLHYVLHLPRWPATDQPGGPLDPPSTGSGSAWDWRTLTLTADEQARKHRALSAFRSQILVMSDFFAAFDRPNELFIDREPSPISPCWCSGNNIAVPINGMQ